MDSKAKLFRSPSNPAPPDGPFCRNTEPLLSTWEWLTLQVDPPGTMIRAIKRMDDGCVVSAITEPY